jgi:hypothetical protein
MFSSQAFSHSFSCAVGDITNNSSTPNLVYIKMSCKASGQFVAGELSGCSSERISDDTVVIDGTTEIGKRYYSQALTAFASQKIYLYLHMEHALARAKRHQLFIL